MSSHDPELPTFDHVGYLEDLTETPRYLVGDHAPGVPLAAAYSCAYCGVGDSGLVSTRTRTATSAPDPAEDGGGRVTLEARTLVIGEPRPTSGCVKLRTSLGHQPTVFPIHAAPSELDPGTGRRVSLTYQDGIQKLAALLIGSCGKFGRTFVYACGQVDYFTIFAFQEVFRLLGVRNLAGNAEHCLNAGAVHNELLTGQEGPFLTLDTAFDGPDRVFLLNGWNGLITHPPVFHRLLKRPGLNAWLVEVAVTETVQAFAAKLGPERVLLIKPGTDPQLALAVAHELFAAHPQAISDSFVERFADRATFDAYAALARREEHGAGSTAARIAAGPTYIERLAAGIRAIAQAFAAERTVPINLPSVGLSQTKGAVAHCLWGNALALVGKYGLKLDGTPAGGTLRIPGQVNAQTEVQGLSRNVFMGRLKMTEEGAREAARRMGLPDDAYARVLATPPVAALDYSDAPAAHSQHLVICFGTQFESNMPGRARWIERLTAKDTTLVVIDPIPDPFALKHARLILPSPPHGAAPKLYQNGEWRLSLSVPRKRRPVETRSDATIVYDTMAALGHLWAADPVNRTLLPELAPHVDSGYVERRFGAGLPRVDGEVSRPFLWQRVLDYMAAGEGRAGALYCRPEHADGRAIAWDDLLAGRTPIYGGVGTSRYRLDDADGQVPFRDVLRRPRRFTFFVPTPADLAAPSGILLNSGRSTMSDDKVRQRFAIATFNSGKATPAVDMPEENPIHVSEELAARLALATGDRVRVTGVVSGGSIVLPVAVTARVKGDSVYVSFHKTRAEIERGLYLNDVTSHAGRCPYTSQSNFKVTEVRLEKVGPGGEPTR